MQIWFYYYRRNASSQTCLDAAVTGIRLSKGSIELLVLRDCDIIHMPLLSNGFHYEECLNMIIITYFGLSVINITYIPLGEDYTKVRKREQHTKEGEGAMKETADPQVQQGRCPQCGSGILAAKETESPWVCEDCRLKPLVSRAEGSAGSSDLPE
ncbi:hypothetical protein [Paenibacillus sp. RC84]|uniref:hypothetical protein n=1 Tax=Paenibacillus sp. RC84 TaxID=3156252 RepID=UPI003514E273